MTAVIFLIRTLVKYVKRRRQAFRQWFAPGDPRTSAAASGVQPCAGWPGLALDREPG